MCFSAKLNAKITVLSDRFDAQPELSLFEALFARRLQDSSIKLLPAMEREFLISDSSTTGRIRDLIQTHRAAQRDKWQTELAKQQKRLTDALRSLESKRTSKAENDQRIATNKIEALERSLAKLEVTDEQPSDSRVFPMMWTPVVYQQGSDRLVRPMRYHCRPAGKPAAYDHKYPGLYNARRDNLTRFWQGQFGVTHAVVLVQKFYENVAAHDYHHRLRVDGEPDQNLVIEYQPNDGSEMVVACLWSHWQQGNDSLDSFAAITDEPPADVAATGHDRCIVPLRDKNIPLWLAPNRLSSGQLNELLSHRQQYSFVHKPII